MEKFIDHTNPAMRSSRRFQRSLGNVFIALLATSILISWSVTASAGESSYLAFAFQPGPALEGFQTDAAMAWGHDVASTPYADAVRRRESVLGTGLIEDAINQPAPLGTLSVFAGESRCGFFLARICVAPRRLPSETETPPDGMATQPREAPPNRDTIAASLSLREEFRVYLVQQGDSLWKIARRFDMSHRALATVNGLAISASLQVGRPLKVKTATSRELRLDLTSGPLARHPSLLEHIRMIDGRPVPRWLVTDYVADILDKRQPGSQETPPGGPMAGMTIVIQFQLVRNLIEGRARRYHPIVLAHAQKFNLDPALIMAMIHTESAFNPKARSHASAYGLMQLVPHTAGREAYQRVYGQRRELTPQYLFDPHNNIELGTAYLHILKNSYLRSITDPLSRTYCAVAAYHAGPSNVWKAFIAEPLIKEAIPAINRLTPADVYQRLVEALPSTESRNYLRDVIKRISLYGDAFGKNSGTMI